MKLLAHSVVPTNPMPYMHLGYFSATTTEVPHATQLVISAQGLAVVALICAFLLQKKRHWYYPLIILAILSIGFSLFIRTYKSAERYEYARVTPYTVTLERFRGLILELESLKMDGKPVPADLTTLYDADWQKRNMVDGWRRPFKVSHEEKDNNLTCHFTSSGRDGRFGTADDIIAVGTYNTRIKVISGKDDGSPYL